MPTAITASGIILSLSKLSCLRHSQGLFTGSARLSKLSCLRHSQGLFTGSTRLSKLSCLRHSQGLFTGSGRLSKLSCLRHFQGLSVLLCWSISRLRRVPVIAHLLMRQSSQSIAKPSELSCLRHSQGLFTGSARLSKLSCLRHFQGLSVILCWSISRLRRVPVIAHLLMRQFSQSIAKLTELSCLRQ